MKIAIELCAFMPFPLYTGFDDIGMLSKPYQNWWKNRESSFSSILNESTAFPVLICLVWLVLKRERMQNFVWEISWKLQQLSCTACFTHTHTHTHALNHHTHTYTHTRARARARTHARTHACTRDYDTAYTHSRVKCQPTYSFSCADFINGGLGKYLDLKPLRGF